MSERSDRPEQPDWWRRLEQRRAARGETMKDLARRIGVTPQSIYNWAQRGRPENIEAVRALAEYMREDYPSLLQELRREPSAVDVLRGYGAWDLGAAYTELGKVVLDHLTASQEPGEVMLDVLLRLLRRHLPDATVSITALSRGVRRRTRFHFAVHVEDPSWTPSEIDAKLRQILRQARMPLSIEHSKELLPEGWRHYPVVLVPIHLAPREAKLSEPSPLGGLIALFLGVWYSGGPDVAATAAQLNGAGSTSITNLAARISSNWDPGSSRQDADLAALQVRIADRITGGLSPVPGPFLWSNNDVPPMLHPDVRERLRSQFRGRLVVLELDDDLLQYAAYRSHTASGSPVELELERLREWQKQLIDTAVERSQNIDETTGQAHAVARVALHLPKEVVSQVVDGETVWPDAVDAMFDLYSEIGIGISEWLSGEATGLTQFDTVMGPQGWRLRPSG